MVTNKKRKCLHKIRTRLRKKNDCSKRSVSNKISLGLRQHTVCYVGTNIPGRNPNRKEERELEFPNFGTSRPWRWKQYIPPKL